MSLYPPYLIYPALQQPVPFNNNFPDPSNDEAMWHKQWADPDLWVNVRKQALVARIASGQTLDPLPRGTPETITVDKYWQPWSTRLYSKPGLAAYLQQALAYSESAQFPETVTESRWHQPWSEPVRFKPALLAGDQPFFTTGAHALGTPYSRGYVIC